MATRSMVRSAFFAFFVGGFLATGCAPSSPAPISLDKTKGNGESDDLPMPREVEVDADAGPELIPVMPRERVAVIVPPDVELLDIQPRRAKEIDFDLTEPDIGLEVLPDLKVEPIENIRVPEPIDPKAPRGVLDLTDTSAMVLPNPNLEVGHVAGGALQSTWNPNFGGLTGTGFTPSMKLFEGRFGTTRDRLMKIHGGNEESEAAVARALIWIAKQQKPDGSWEFDGSAKTDKAAATAMALLTFLGAGETHLTGKKYKSNVMKGLNYLRGQQAPNGQVGKGTLYSQAFCALALCEASGMTGDPAMKRLAKLAIDYIINAQASNGSWGYSPRMDGDTSITGWQIQALKSAISANIVVPKICFEKADKYLSTVSSAEGSQFGYRNNESSTPTLSAVGLYSRQLMVLNPKDPALAKGIATIWEKAKPDEKNVNTYQLYYVTYLVKLQDGPAWQRDWNPAMRTLLIKLQIKPSSPNAKAADVGSYPRDMGFIGSSCGTLGTTCMSTLCLEVYYRQLSKLATEK